MTRLQPDDVVRAQVVQKRGPVRSRHADGRPVFQDGESGVIHVIAERVHDFTPLLANLSSAGPKEIDPSTPTDEPRKGGPGIMRSDLLLINKIDLAPHVGASLEVMERDARKMRGDRPFVFTNLKTGEGAAAVAGFVERAGGMAGVGAA